jgi:glutathione peroxidase
LTDQNYAELQQLYEKYSADLEILGFPCNNFGKQEPGSNEEIRAFATGKGATWPVLGKLDCENGNDTAPLYKFLRSGLSGGILGHCKCPLFEFILRFRMGYYTEE